MMDRRVDGRDRWGERETEIVASIYLFIILPICITIVHYIVLSVYQPIYGSIILFIVLSFSKSTNHPFIHPSLSICLSVITCILFFLYRYTLFSLYHYICLSVFRYIVLSVFISYHSLSIIPFIYCSIII